MYTLIHAFLTPELRDLSFMAQALEPGNNTDCRPPAPIGNLYRQLTALICRKFRSETS
ncbi:hypothetical protein PSAC2689_80002 [Paraburkholderia sacchari]